MPEIATSLSVYANPWLSCALLLALRLYLPGICWLWLAPGWPDSRPRRFLATQAVALSIGLTASALFTYLLGTFGIYSLLMEIGCLTLFSLIGVGLGFLRNRQLHFIPWPFIPIGLVTLFILHGVVMLLPLRGEWIAGGWDPGLYVMEGINLSRTGSLQPDQPEWLQQLTEEELSLFIRDSYNFTEYLPVVPIQTEERAIERFFFHMTPSIVALLDRAGDVRAATRLNLFMWMWCILLLAGVLKQMELGTPFITATLLLFALHPITLYHTTFPTSELVHVFFLFSLFLWQPLLRLGRSAQVVTGFIFLCAILNRHTFIAFAPLFLLIHCWTEQRVRQRIPPWSELLFSAIGLLVGFLLNHVTSPSTLARISTQLPLVYLAGIVFAVGTVGYVLALRTAFSPRLHTCISVAMLPLLVFSTTLLLFTVWFSPMDTIAEGKNGYRAAWAYLTPGAISVAGLGVVAAYFARRRLPARLLGILWVCSIITLLSLANLSISNQYPWATRRFLIYTVPLLAFGGGIVMHLCWTTRRWWFQLLGIGIILVPLLINRPRMQFVLQHTEFNGLSESLHHVAQHIPPDDFIIADHFRWGTPLYYLHQRNVINGELFWSSDDPTQFKKAVAALQRIKHADQHIWLLTSTEKGLEVFPVSTQVVKEVTQPTPWQYEEYVHHAKLRDYRVQKKRKTFRLYMLNNSDI